MVLHGGIVCVIGGGSDFAQRDGRDAAAAEQFFGRQH